MKYKERRILKIPKRELRLIDNLEVYVIYLFVGRYLFKHETKIKVLLKQCKIRQTHRGSNWN